ncbi:MAG TPA: TIGR00730 family Rossman fold protein [Acidimicrobiales bacterium]
MTPALRRVCVFCASSPGVRAEYRDLAAELGATLAESAVEVVYGGGHVGLMGVVADAALAAGGRVIGVIPRGLFAREIAHTEVTELHEVDSMHERKRLMYDLSDAFVALPGAYGTLDELAEVTTWAQLGLHRKPVALLDTGGFWDGLVVQLDRMVADGYLTPTRRTIVQRYDRVDALLEALAVFEPPPPEGVIDADER